MHSFENYIFSFSKNLEISFQRLIKKTWKILANRYQNLLELILQKSKKDPLSSIQKEKRWLERRKNFRKNAEAHCQSVAKVNYKGLKPIKMCKGLPNPLNRCYLNASIQSIEAGLNEDFNLQSLLKKNLALQKGETLMQLERRLLKEFAPLYRCRDESLTHFTDRILFKWSFLLLLQAKKYHPKSTAKAIEEHFKICFAISLQGDFHADFKQEETEQKDAASYIEMWYDILQMPFIQYETINSAKIGEKIYCKEPREEKISLLQLSLYKDLKTEKKAWSEELLKNYFSNEPIDEEMYEFEGKSIRVKNSIRSTKITSLPKLLFIHFKRFSNGLEPLNQSILPFTNDQIDFSEFIKPNNSEKKTLYSLKSIIVHQGATLEGGHYVSYVKSKEGGWHHCNDQQVKKVGYDQVPRESSYIAIFYQN